MKHANLTRTRIAHEDYIAHNDDVIAADCNNEMVLLRVKSTRCYGMNEIGAYIWRKLSKPTQVADLVRTLELDLSPDPDECSPQVLEFLEQLSHEGLIIQVPEPTRADDVRITDRR
jgi:hypothetical protein